MAIKPNSFLVTSSPTSQQGQQIREVNVLPKANYTQLIKDSVCWCCPEMLVLAHKLQKMGISLQKSALINMERSYRAPLLLSTPKFSVLGGTRLTEPAIKTTEPSPANSE